MPVKTDLSRIPSILDDAQFPFYKWGRDFAEVARLVALAEAAKENDSPFEPYAFLEANVEDWRQELLAALAGAKIYILGLATEVMAEDGKTNVPAGYYIVKHLDGRGSKKSVGVIKLSLVLKHGSRKKFTLQLRLEPSQIAGFFRV